MKGTIKKYFIYSDLQKLVEIWEKVEEKKKMEEKDQEGILKLERNKDIRWNIIEKSMKIK